MGKNGMRCEQGVHASAPGASRQARRRPDFGLINLAAGGTSPYHTASDTAEWFSPLPVTFRLVARCMLNRLTCCG